MNYNFEQLQLTKTTTTTKTQFKHLTRLKSTLFVQINIQKTMPNS